MNICHLEIGIKSSRLTFGKTLKSKGLDLASLGIEWPNFIDVVSWLFKTFGILKTTNFYKKMEFPKDSKMNACESAWDHDQLHP